MDRDIEFCRLAMYADLQAEIALSPDLNTAWRRIASGYWQLARLRAAGLTWPDAGAARSAGTLAVR